MQRVLVTGAGGFIGHHLVGYLKRQGYWVRGADLKAPQFAPSAADEFLLLDLRRWDDCLQAAAGVDHVYNLASDMGGMGFLSKNHAQIMHNNLLISTHMVEAARQQGASRFLYSSSVCVYPDYRQQEAQIAPLREEDAYPAQPQDAYGWEKLTTERLLAHYREAYGMQTKVVRFQNIFGPYGDWEGGREKVPAAICRKVAQARLSGNPEVEIWGDGEQTRAFCYVDDCVRGVHALLTSEHPGPVNLGQDRTVSINQLADMVAAAAGITIVKRHIPGPQGVRGSTSDTSRIRELLGWQPEVSLEDGIARTYSWVEEQLRQKLAREEQVARAAD